jgi:uncharacterized protein involved in outer membrane biogenesis
MNKAIKIGLGIAGLVLLLGVIAMFYIASYLENNIDKLQQEVSASLGRQVEFEQGIKLRWSLRPSIVIKGIRVGNPEWAKGKYLIAAENAVLEFRLPGLLRQRFDISQVVLEKADVILESTKDGKQNWVFDSDGSADTSILPDSVYISDSRLLYRSPAGREHSITIDEFEIEGLDDRDIDVEGDIHYGKLPISISMESGSRVVIETHGKQAGSFRVAARIKRDNQFLDLKDIEIKTGESVLTGEARLPISDGQGLQLDLRSDLLDLTPYLALDDAGSKGMKSILGYQLTPGSMKGVSGQIKMETRQLKVGDIQFDDFALDANINAGQLKLALKDNAGKINTSIDVKPAVSAWHVKFQQNSTIDIGEVLEAGSDGGSRTRANAVLDINLSGSGKSLEGILGSAQGAMSLKIGEGNLSKAMADLLPLGGVLDSLLTTVSAKTGAKDRSRLECAVLTMNVTKGIAKSNSGLAVRTRDVNMLGGGSLKLATGEINFHFKTARRKGVGVSVKGFAENFIHLTGTLRQPKGGVDTASLLVHGGGAVATGGASILYDSLAKRLTSASNPCEIVLKASTMNAAK